MRKPTPPWVAGLAVLLGFPTHAQSARAQQVLEIDFASGRTVIDYEFRSLGAHLVLADWDGGVLYAAAEEEPEGIMAFSLETGEWLRTISTPKGEGPYEFPHGRSGMALRPGGGLYVAGVLRVVEYDAEGAPIDYWSPHAPPSKRICTLGGAPAVPTQGGVVRLGPDGMNEPIGPVVAKGRSVSGETAAERHEVGFRLTTARIARAPDGLRNVPRPPILPSDTMSHVTNKRRSKEDSMLKKLLLTRLCHTVVGGISLLPLASAASVAQTPVVELPAEDVELSAEFEEVFRVGGYGDEWQLLASVASLGWFFPLSGG